MMCLFFDFCDYINHTNQSIHINHRLENNFCKNTEGVSQNKTYKGLNALLVL
jgi:hypothetical protein